LPKLALQPVETFRPHHPRKNRHVFLADVVFVSRLSDGYHVWEIAHSTQRGAAAFSALI
jgi:hypothetical protein